MGSTKVMATIAAIFVCVGGLLATGPTVAAAKSEVSPSGSADSSPVQRMGLGRLMPVDVTSFVDDSESQYTNGTGPGSDPGDVRYEAARFLRDFLASTATVGLDHRMAVVHFGTAAPAELAVPLTPVTDPDGLLARALQPARLGYTNFAAAFDRGGELLAATRDGRRVVWVVYTDGIPDDGSGRPLEAQFADIQAALSRHPEVRVHLIARVDGPAWALVEPYWRSLGLASVERLGDVAELGTKYQGILRNEMGLGRGDEATLRAPGDEAAVTLPPYLEGLTVSAFGADTAMELELVGPDGPQTPEVVGDGRTRLLAVRNPAAGRWHVRLVRGGPVLVAIDRVPLVARLTAPGAEAPQGRALRVEATFLTSDGLALAELTEAPRFLGASVTSPDGTVHEVELRETTLGRFRASESVATPVAGAYTVALTMRGVAEAAVADTVVTVTVSPRPYLELVAPLAPVAPGSPLVAEAELRVAGSPSDPYMTFGDDPRGVAVARLVAEDRTVETVRMDPADGARFVAAFRTPMRTDVAYSVETELGGTLVDGRAVADHWRSDPIAVQRTMWQVLAAIGRAVSVALAIAVALIVLAWLMWFAIWLRPGHGRVRLSEQSVFLQGTRARRVLLDGKRTWVWIGRDGVVRTGIRRIPLPWGAAAHPRARVL